MRHRKRTSKLGRRTEHRQSMLANQACSLIFEERIKTTVPKAKETRRLVEKVITLGKRGTLHTRRQAISKIRNKYAVSKVFDDLAARFMERPGGYTRIIRIGTRDGDAADICFLELVEAGIPGSVPAASIAAPAATEEAPAEEAAAPIEEAAEQETTDLGDDASEVVTEASADEVPDADEAAEEEPKAEAEETADEEEEDKDAK